VGKGEEEAERDDDMRMGQGDAQVVAPNERERRSGDRWADDVEMEQGCTVDKTDEMTTEAQDNKRKGDSTTGTTNREQATLYQTYENTVTGTAETAERRGTTVTNMAINETTIQDRQENEPSRQVEGPNSNKKPKMERVCAKGRDKSRTRSRYKM
jgi:hypothetical protein